MMMTWSMIFMTSRVMFCDPPLTHREAAEAMDITFSVLSKNGVSQNVNFSAFDPFETKQAMEEKAQKLEEKVGEVTYLSSQYVSTDMVFRMHVVPVVWMCIGNNLGYFNIIFF